MQFDAQGRGTLVACKGGPDVLHVWEQQDDHPNGMQTMRCKRCGLAKERP
jgi:hypothetical protein